MKWFSKRTSIPLKVDIHSHLIPGIDDGASSLKDSMDMLRAFYELGFRKVVTTPHIHPRYPNNKEAIVNGLRDLHQAIENDGLDIELEAAAEYYVDENFLEKLNSGHDLLTFGDRYLLVECSFVNKPFFFENAIFDMIEKGYNPILAHPERYQFLEGNIDWLMELKSLGILFQVTLGSLSGYYGELPRQLGKKLLKEGMVDFLASDLHRMSQVGHLRSSLRLKEVQTIIKRDQLLNNSLV